MHRFLMGIKRKPDDEPTANSSRSCMSKLKLHKHDKSYLSFSFTSVIINSEEKPQRILYLTILAADSMMPNKQMPPRNETFRNEKTSPKNTSAENLIKFASSKRVLLILLLCLQSPVIKNSTEQEAAQDYCKLLYSLLQQTWYKQ
jgi:hypothetical protein